MPFTIDMTTIRVVVAMTTPSSVRKERSLWLPSASMQPEGLARRHPYGDGLVFPGHSLPPASAEIIA